MQYESAGKRRDGKISREGSVALRRALMDLGMGLWLTEPAAKTTPPNSNSAASTAASSPARWLTVPTASPTHSFATTPPTNRPAGPEPPDSHPRKDRPDPFTTPVGSATLSGRDEGPDQMPLRLWRTPTGLRRD